jgi:hypothetical protein
MPNAQCPMPNVQRITNAEGPKRCKSCTWTVPSRTFSGDAPPERLYPRRGWQIPTAIQCELPAKFGCALCVFEETLSASGLAFAVQGFRFKVQSCGKQRGSGPWHGCQSRLPSPSVAWRWARRERDGSLGKSQSRLTSSCYESVRKSTSSRRWLREAAECFCNFWSGVTL